MATRMDVFTTPTVAPLYPMPPIHYHDASLVVAMLEAPAHVDLPRGVRTDTGGAVVLFADYPHSDAGPYREVIVLTPVVVDGENGSFCALIYVTSDAAMAAGREVWGFPKKIADINITIDDEGKVRAMLERNGARLLLAGTLDAPVDPTMFGDMASKPVFNERIVPSVSGDHSRTTVTGVRMVMSPHEARLGSGVLECVSGGQDPFAEVLCERSNAGLAWVRTDAILPFGWVARP